MVADALLIGLLARQFRVRAADDWRRWLATFTTVVWKFGQPAAPPPATMAEQLCVGALTRYAQTGVVDLARDGMVDLDVPDDGGIDVELWAEEYPRTSTTSCCTTRRSTVSTTTRRIISTGSGGWTTRAVLHRRAGCGAGVHRHRRPQDQLVQLPPRHLGRSLHHHVPTDSPLRQVRRHDLRHAAITAWLNAGVPLKTCQVWSGHATVSVLLDTCLGATGDDD